jgi:hypothetical protein
VSPSGLSAVQPAPQSFGLHGNLADALFERDPRGAVSRGAVSRGAVRLIHLKAEDLVGAFRGQ